MDIIYLFTNSKQMQDGGELHEHNFQVSRDDGQQEVVKLWTPTIAPDPNVGPGSFVTLEFELGTGWNGDKKRTDFKHRLTAIRSASKLDTVASTNGAGAKA